MQNEGCENPAKAGWSGMEFEKGRRSRHQMEAQRSGFHLERTSNGMKRIPGESRVEWNGVCEDDMHNELTEIDIQKMKEELDYRRITLRPQLLEEVKVARSFGDLSENFEYKAAKREKNKNESRIRFLENMIKTARVIEDHSGADTVGLYDKVTVYLEEDDEEETWQIVTTVRQDVLRGLISKEAPMGSALLGKKVGDRFYVQVNKDYGYYAQVRAIEKGKDDGTVALNRF